MWCLIAARRVAYNCVCVEVKEAASSPDAWPKKEKRKKKNSRRSRNQIPEEMASLLASALSLVLGAWWHGEHGVGSQATLLLDRHRDELGPGRLGKRDQRLLRTQEGRGRESRVLRWQPGIGILRGRVIRCGAQIRRPGRHG